MHLKPTKSDRHAAHADPLIAIAGGGGVNLFNSMGSAEFKLSRTLGKTSCQK